VTRRNRRNPNELLHAAVHENPAAYTRATRRAAGHRGGVHVTAMRAFYSLNQVLPRAVRRAFRDNEHAEHRIAKNKAKLDRLLAPYQRSM